MSLIILLPADTALNWAHCRTTWINFTLTAIIQIYIVRCCNNDYSRFANALMSNKRDLHAIELAQKKD